VIGNYGAFVEYSALNILHSYPQLIGFYTNVYEYYVEQYNFCGYNVSLEYPAPEPYPLLRDPTTSMHGITCTKEGSQETNSNRRRDITQPLATSLGRQLHDRGIHNQLRKLVHRYNIANEAALIPGDVKWKRQADDESHPFIHGPIGRLNETSGCFLIEDILRNAAEYFVPWSTFTYFPHNLPLITLVRGQQ
jgi:hypothetical protein